MKILAGMKSWAILGGPTIFFNKVLKQFFN